MSGITGVLDLSRPVTERELERFTDALAHRGPDGRGCVIDGGIGLGHRRLAVFDLAKRDGGPPASCPLPYGGADGRRYWITCDGRLYNFLELRRELEELGHAFRTDGDTEVVVAAFAQWGLACLERFNGMWALAIWDSQERRLLLARDRFGVKPLYFWTMGTRLAFASEIKAFLELEGFTPALDPESARIALANPLAAEGSRLETIMQGVRRLPPGQALTVDSTGQLILRQWWDTKAHLPQLPALYLDQALEFRSLFMDAVRLRLRSDVPIGIHLGGDLESSAVAAGMVWFQQQASGLERAAGLVGMRTFIAGFPDALANSRGQADQMAAHLGATPHRWAVSEADLLSHVVASLWVQEDIHGSTTAPAWSLYREMRAQDTVVTLDGCGGDELLGGLIPHLDWPMEQFNDNLHLEFHQTRLPAILRNHDRCAMAHGVETRMPFLDWRLVCYASALASEAKVGGGTTKRILRDTMVGLVPDPLRWRRTKPDFDGLAIEWFNGGLAPLIRQVVAHPLWLDSPFWDGPGLRDFTLAKTAARAWSPADRSAATTVWTMINLVLWQILFVERRGPAFPWR